MIGKEGRARVVHDLARPDHQRTARSSKVADQGYSTPRAQQLADSASRQAEVRFIWPQMPARCLRPRTSAVARASDLGP